MSRTKTTKNVKTIPATLRQFSSTPINEQRKRRTAGYARVSTDSEEQFTSYEAQVDYYTIFIKSREDWEFVKVYTDEGISGTNTKKREGFRRVNGIIKMNKKWNIKMYKNVQPFYPNRRRDSYGRHIKSTANNNKNYGSKAKFFRTKQKVWV